MPDKPNIIFVMPDQLRPDFLSCYDAAFIDTPHIDSLCDRGVLYSNAYSAHPVCVPARSALMTGMHGIRTGVLDNGQFLRPDLNECGIQTWPQILAENGYYTAAIGKMHFYPWDLRLGFQYRSIAEDKRWIYIRDDYYHYLKAAGLRKLHGNEHEGYFENKGAIVNKLPWEYQCDHFVGLESCRFIREHADEGPFAMMIGFPGPHCPYDPAPEFLEPFDPEDMPEPVPEVPGDTPGIRQSNIQGNLGDWNGVDLSEYTVAQQKKVRAHYAALVKQIDYEVGEILKTLEETGVRDNTVILFSADHGDYLGDHNLAGKGQFYESSWHVPMMAHVPWAEGSTTRNELVELTDVTATMLHFAGIEKPVYMNSQVMPGLGDDETTGREYIVGAVSGGWGIYDGEWRLAKYGTGECVMFHITEDPTEQVNLYNDPRQIDIRTRLDTLLTQTVMEYSRDAFAPQRVYVRDLSQTNEFGREGWVRPYPRDVTET